MKCNSNLHHFSLYNVLFTLNDLIYHPTRIWMWKCIFFYFFYFKSELMRGDWEVKRSKWVEHKLILNINCLIVYTTDNRGKYFVISFSLLSLLRSLVITLYLEYFIIMSIIFLIRSHLFSNRNNDFFSVIRNSFFGFFFKNFSSLTAMKKTHATNNGLLEWKKDLGMIEKLFWNAS